MEEARSQLATVQTENEALKEAATENTRYYAGVMNEAGAKIGRIENELDEARSQLAAVQTNPQPQHQLYAKIEELEERNRLLSIKGREERQKLEEKIAALEYRDISQSRRLAEKQTRLDELEAAAELQQKSATANKDLPEAANVLKKLRKALGKKSTASLSDIETILEIIEGDGNE